MAEIESAAAVARKTYYDGDAPFEEVLRVIEQWGKAQREAGRHEQFLAGAEPFSPGVEPEPSLVEQVTPMLGITDTDPSVDGYETAVLTLAERIDELAARVDKLT